MPVKQVDVLLVDDDAALRKMLCAVLAHEGYKVRTAEDGLSALVELASQAPSVLISDLNMPGMSGFELLLLVRGQFPNVALIAMSGAFSGKQVPAGASADAFYEKGTSPLSLLTMLSSLTHPQDGHSGNNPNTRPAPRTFPLRLAKSLGEMASALARRDGVSLNHFISVAVAEKISRLESHSEAAPGARSA